MFVASTGADSKTFDEIVATMHLNKTTHSMEAYRKLLEDLTVSLLCHVSHLQMYNTFYFLMVFYVFDVRIGKMVIMFTYFTVNYEFDGN